MVTAMRNAAPLAGALLALLLGVFAPVTALAQKTLPLSTTFKGTSKFEALVKRAEKENWRALPLGDRTIAVGLALVGTPYVNYTLEIDDHIEAPSVNLNGLDCWTFYESSLAFARMLRAYDPPYTPQKMLSMIEIERYRGGKSNGVYTTRLHHLEDLYQDNQKRGLMDDMTRQLGGVRIYRNVREMQVAWKSYRYLRNNPSLRPEMARIENRITAMPVFHVPKSRVAAIEPQLRNGDVISITSTGDGGYTQHVGLIYKDRGGVARFVHASSKKGVRAVTIDSRISGYLAASSGRAGILVGRPKEVVTARQYAEAR